MDHQFNCHSTLHYTIDSNNLLNDTYKHLLIIKQLNNANAKVSNLKIIYIHFLYLLSSGNQGAC